jgi:D-glycero-D-manno-heptose 1,7-bisphosphate phosphatase
MITHECVERIHDELRSQLARHGASLDAIYYCPLVPAGADRSLVEHPDRKPGPGMLLRAALDLGLDLATSWMVGDLISDGLAGHHARCRGSILVCTGLDLTCGRNQLCPDLRCSDNLLAGVDLIVDDRTRSMT